VLITHGVYNNGPTVGSGNDVAATRNTLPTKADLEARTPAAFQIEAQESGIVWPDGGDVGNGRGCVCDGGHI